MKPLHILLTQMILCSALSAAGKPNIIVMMGDDMGYSDIGCYGSEIKTPVLDKLGEMVGKWGAWADRVGVQPWPIQRPKKK